MPKIILPSGVEVLCDTADEAIAFVDLYNAELAKDAAEREARRLCRLSRANNRRLERSWERLYLLEYWYPYLASKE